MRDECLNYWYVHDSQHPVSRLVAKIGEKSQQKTMNDGDRPYGVGILIGGVDSAGTHLYETSPSGEYFEYYAMAIGARSQSAKTYLEKNFQSFEGCSRDELIKHGISALRASAQETDLSEKNVSVGVVSEGETFKRLSEEEIKPFLAEQEGGDVEMIEA
jgi:20S proteasome subunit alpha 6